MTTTIAVDTSAIGAPSTPPQPIAFGRLLRVEWAKATDTRASRWLLGLMAATTIGLMLVPVLAPSRIEQSSTSYLNFAAAGLGIFLPVVAVLMLTTEWSQRSVLTTFTQEPRRVRVIKAKLAAAFLLGGGAALYGAVVTAAGLGVAAASGRAVEANLTAGAAVGFVLCALLNVGLGVALGALLQSSATAVAACFVIPTATGLLLAAAKPVGGWLDASNAIDWVLTNQWGGHVPQIAFSVILWIAIPLAIGIARTTRRDVT